MLLFLFATDHRHIFCSSWIRGISENSRKQICIACSKSVFYKLFSRTEGGWYWKVKERDTVNSTANLSTIRYLTNRSMIQVHHITEVSKTCLLAPHTFPLPKATARLASLADIFPIWSGAFNFSPDAFDYRTFDWQRRDSLFAEPPAVYGHQRNRKNESLFLFLNLNTALYKSIAETFSATFDKSHWVKQYNEVWDSTIHFWKLTLHYFK